MFTVNDDLSIYVTRGDMVYLTIKTTKNGKPYTFQVGEVIRFNVCEKKNCDKVVLQKDFPVTAVTQGVDIVLDGYDTKIGEVISKPTDYWYEVVLNPFDEPQTIIGYDMDGTRVFRLFPEANDKPAPEPKPDVIKVIDTELDMTSERPVQNQAIARAFYNLLDGYQRTRDAVSKLHVTPEMFGAIGDGESDDTEAFQRMLDAVEEGGSVFIPSGEYAVNTFSTKKDGAFGCYGLLLYKKKNININFADGAILKSIANSDNAQFSALLGIVECEDIRVIGGELIGELDEHTFSSATDTTTFTQSGVWINSSKNVIVDGVTAHNFIAGCIYVGGSPKSNNVELRNCTAYHSHYHAIVIEGADNVKIINTTAYDANTNRAFGTSIDIEGLSEENKNENITVDGCYFGAAETSSLNINKCKNVYIQNTRIAGQKLTIQPSENVYVSNCYFEDAKIHILQGGQKNIVIDGNKLVNNNIKAQIYSNDERTIEDLVIRNNTIVFDTEFESETYGIPFFDIGGYGQINASIVGNICKCSSGRIMLVKASGGSGMHGITIIDNKFFIGSPKDNVTLLYRDLVYLSKIQADFIRNVIVMYLADTITIASGTSTSTTINLCMLTPNGANGFKIIGNDISIFGKATSVLNLLNTYTELSSAPTTRYLDYFDNKIYSALSNTKGLSIPVNYKARVYSNIVTSGLTSLASETQNGISAKNNIFDTVV